jgi:hypothetical protein
MKLDVREQMRQRARAAALELHLSEADALVVEEIGATHAEVEILGAMAADAAAVAAVAERRRTLDAMWTNLEAAARAKAERAINVALTGILGDLVRGRLLL